MRTVEAAGLSIGDEHPPRVMGVLNLSPESPYGPSVFEDAAAAAEHVDDLVRDGADIVDIGLESANKRFDVRSAEWELDRLDLAVETIEQVEAEPVFSIETRYAQVADAALSRGFDMVNDIAGFADPDMPAVCESHEAAVVKMAGPGDLNRPGALDTVDEIYAALAENLTERTIVDPAFGGWSRSKTLEADRETFRRLREFSALDHPLLVSINRKNFLKDIVSRDTAQALPASLAATAMAVERGADVIRTHDVEATRDAALVGQEFTRERLQQPDLQELDVTTVPEAERYLRRLGLSTDEAAGMVATMYRVTGLAPDAAASVAAEAETTAVTVAADGQTLLLGGTRAALAALAARLEGGRFDRIAEAIDQ